MSFQWSRPYLSVVRAAVTERRTITARVRTIPTTIPTAKSACTPKDVMLCGGRSRWKRTVPQFLQGKSFRKSCTPQPQPQSLFIRLFLGLLLFLSLINPRNPNAKVISKPHTRLDTSLQQHHAVPTPRTNHPHAMLPVHPLIPRSAHDGLDGVPAVRRAQRPRESGRVQGLCRVERTSAHDRPRRHGVQRFGPRAALGELRPQGDGVRRERVDYVVRARRGLHAVV